VDQAAEELLGVPVGGGALPVGENDRPRMLAARPVLRKRVAPVIRAAGDDDAGVASKVSRSDSVEERRKPDRDDGSPR